MVRTDRNCRRMSSPPNIDRYAEMVSRQRNNSSHERVLPGYSVFRLAFRTIVAKVKVYCNPSGFEVLRLGIIISLYRL
jgi:hypothetical protein